jgi:hypothetical protein
MFSLLVSFELLHQVIVFLTYSFTSWFLLLKVNNWLFFSTCQVSHSVVKILFFPLVLNFSMHAFNKHMLGTLQHFIVWNHLFILVAFVRRESIRVLCFLSSLGHWLHHLCALNSVCFDKLLLFCDNLLQRPTLFRSGLQTSFKFFVSHHMTFNFSWDLSEGFGCWFTSALQDFDFSFANSVNKFF